MTVTQILPTSPGAPGGGDLLRSPSQGEGEGSALRALAAVGQVAAGAAGVVAGLGSARDGGSAKDGPGGITSHQRSPDSANPPRPALDSIGSVGNFDLFDEPGPSRRRGSSPSRSPPAASASGSGSGTRSTSPQLHAEDIPPCTPRKHRFAHQPRPHPLERDRERSSRGSGSGSGSRRGSGAGIPTSRSAGDLIAGAGAELMSASGASRPRAIGRGSNGRDRGKRGKGRYGFDVGEEEVLDSPVQDLANYDNSARFYFHHPFSKSASTSPTRSKGGLFLAAEPVASGSGSGEDGPTVTLPFAPLGNLLARRNSSLPAQASSQIQDALSPNARHIELAVRPATPGQVVDEAADKAAAMAASVGMGLLNPPKTTSMLGIDDSLQAGPGRLVILTPTTQEWRELGLDNLQALGGEGVTSEDSDSDRDRRGSGDSSVDGHAAGQGRAHSGLGLLGVQHDQTDADALLVGATDRNPFEETLEPPSRDGARSAPPMLEDSELWNRLAMLQNETQQDSALDDERSRPSSPKAPGHASHRSESLIPHAPVPLSLSRSQSMRAPDPGAKKETARERLFRMVGEEVEKEGLGGSSGSWGVRQIGNGLGLGELPSAKEQGNTSNATRAGSAPAAMRPPGADAGPEPPRTESPLPAPVPQRLTKGVPTPSPLSAVVSASPEPSIPSTGQRSRKPTRAYSRQPSLNGASLPSSADSEAAPMTSRRRQSQRLSLAPGRSMQPFAFPSVLPPSHPSNHASNKKPSVGGLASFSPFFSPPNPMDSAQSRPGSPKRAGSGLKIPTMAAMGRTDSTISFAPSIAAPSECGTPDGETVGGIGGRGIHDYIIDSEAGKGAYGLVKRAHQRGPDNRGCGEEVIIKYIIKSRILADCWKRHKRLGPIPIEIHVMDQLRNVKYKAPARSQPWDPSRAQTPTATLKPDPTAALATTPTSPVKPLNGDATETYPDSNGDGSPWNPRLTSETLKDRGHPNVCKMLDFFEDKEFYYLVMPRFGVGLDLFDRVESAPDGLPPFEIRSILGQLADALTFLHANGIVHRDIKDENVILDGQGHAQLIDFGSAAHWRPGRKWDTFSGTLDYASPEILSGEMYSGKEQDVWALGVVGYVLICGETPFLSADEARAGLCAGSRSMDALDERCGGAHADEGLEADGGGRLGDAKDAVERCLEMDPADRPSAEVLLGHRFIVGAAEGWVGHRGWEK